MERDLTRGVAAIILAAGANERLQSIVPPYMKPLILVNGKPLIKHAVDHALNDWDVSQVVIVAGPENAKQLMSVLPQNDNIDWVLQPHPRGFIDALSRGMLSVKRDRVVILCADNTFASSVPMPALEDTRTWIGVRRDIQDGARFTKLSDEHLGTVAYDPQGATCWIGPVYAYTERLISVLKTGPASANELIASLGFMHPLEMRCQDLGIPEEHA